jgi:hypothetical protein
MIELLISMSNAMSTALRKIAAEVDELRLAIDSGPRR